MLEDKWVEEDESRLKDILRKEIEQRDDTQSGTLQQSFQSDREACVCDLVRWGVRVYNKRCRDDAEKWRSTRIDRWIELSKMDEALAKTKVDLNIKLALGATKSSHVNPQNHNTPTEIQNDAFALNDLPLLSEFIEGEVPYLTSKILQHFDPMQRDYQGDATYANKAEVSSFVSMAIQDALKYMNALIIHNTPAGSEPILLSLQTECSMFSNKPDHFVVSAGYWSWM